MSGWNFSTCKTDVIIELSKSFFRIHFQTDVKKRLIKTLTISGYVANGLLSIITLLAAYGGVVNPETSTIPAILAMTFPFWICLTVVTLLVDLIFKKAMAIIPGTTIVLSLGPILNFCPLNLSHDKLTPEEEARSFTFMSYNVCGLNDFRIPTSPKDSISLYEEAMSGMSNPTMSHVIRQNADIVCLQELWWTLKPNHRVISPALLDSIFTEYPYRAMNKGNAVLSKFPLYSIPDFNDPKSLAVVAEIQGHRTLIICVHLQSIGLDSSDKILYHEITEGEGGRKAISGARHKLLSKLSKAFRNRASQARQIRHKIDSIGIDNVIIAGDFNDIQDCYAIRQLVRDDFKSAFAMAGCGPVITYHDNRFYFQIDHILYRGKLDAIGFKRDNFDRSDHYPVQARFLWSETAPTIDRHLKGIDLINREKTDSI